MSKYLSLERDDLVINPALLARLPAGLAAYYLALPLACEDGAVSVAMAHPENTTALTVLGDLFEAAVVPVRAQPEALRGALHRLYADDGVTEPQVLCWSAHAGEPALVEGVAAAFAAALSGALTALSAGELDLESVLAVAARGSYRLAVLSPPPTQPLAPLLQEVAAPLLLLHGNELPVRRALIALRGFAADYYALDWLGPLLQQPATVTLLPLPHTSSQESRPLLPVNGAAKSHLAHCLRHPALDAARTFVRFRQGPAARQVIDELRQERYDLLAIAAEGHGRFVGDVLAAAEAEVELSKTAVFLLRPPGHAPQGASPRADAVFKHTDVLSNTEE